MVGVMVAASMCRNISPTIFFSRVGGTPPAVASFLILLATDLETKAAGRAAARTSVSLTHPSSAKRWIGPHLEDWAIAHPPQSSDGAAIILNCATGGVYLPDIS